MSPKIIKYRVQGAKIQKYRVRKYKDTKIQKIQKYKNTKIYRMNLSNKLKQLGATHINQYKIQNKNTHKIQNILKNKENIIVSLEGGAKIVCKNDDLLCPFDTNYRGLCKKDRNCNEEYFEEKCYLPEIMWNEEDSEDIEKRKSYEFGKKR